MVDSQNKPQSPQLKSAILMLLGSLLLGFVITRSIYVYQKYNSPLDSVDVVVEKPLSIDEALPQMVLDVSTPLEETQDAVQVVAEVEEFFEAQSEVDDGDLDDIFRRIPSRIYIPSIGLDSEIGFATLRDITVFGETYQQWVAPSDIVGWHFRSALLGDPGNTVLNGHHNVQGEVFKELSLVQKGDEISLYSDAGRFYYQVVSVMILPERFETQEVRLENARWIQQSEDERITLISCWPYESNTHRVIVVAFPIDPPTD
jgi:sortase A